MNPELILVDGTAFLFRAYFANIKQSLSNNEGFPTGAMFGVLSSIRRLERSYPEAKIIMIFDAKGNNFRHDIYPEYKSHRKPAEDDLIKQINPLYEIISNMGYHFLCIDGVEADDVIATLTTQTKIKNIKTLIASSDKDLMQLVDDKTYQLDMKGNLLDVNAVVKKLGVLPNQILDLLALSGDSADNIPGVPNVGPKTAVKWLNQYQNITNIKKNAIQIKGSVGEKLRDNFVNLDLSYELVKLKFDVQIPFDIFTKNPIKNTEKLIILFKKYGFNLWLKEIDIKANSVIKEQEKTSKLDNSKLLDSYSQTIIYTQNEFDKLLKKLENCKFFTFDLETTGLDYMNDTIVALVFLLKKDSYYLPIAHNYLGVPSQLEASLVLKQITSILTNKKIGKIGQNLKYDSHILKNHNIDLQGIIADTMLISHTLNSTITKHNMDDLAKFYLDYQTIKFSDVAGKGKNQITFDQIEIKTAANYACEDVIITYELFMKLNNKIIKIPSLSKLYQSLELPLISAMVQIERNGVQIDSSALNNQHTQLQEKINNLKQQIWEMAGLEFNIDSTKQLQVVLFDQEGLNLKTSKKTSGGSLSTGEEALKNLEHPIADLLLQYRSLNKLITTYLQALPKVINLKTNRLHTSYHQSGTATGRLSSSKPNLQNIPIRSTEGAKIRSAFVANDGYKIVAADYSQIELRIMAHISLDENLIQAFNDNEDIHKSTASLMFKIPLKEINNQQRRNAKAINFGLMYGMGAFNLAKQIGESRTIAKQYIEDYFKSYKQVKVYMDSIKAKIIEIGFVETIMGRRLYVPQINSTNKTIQAHALRTAINAPMQGSSADIIKQAMLKIHHLIKDDNHIKMIMQVHDELVFEVQENKVKNFSQQLKKIMQSVVTLKVPLIVDIGVGNNWQEAH